MEIQLLISLSKKVLSFCLSVTVKKINKSDNYMVKNYSFQILALAQNTLSREKALKNASKKKQREQFLC